MEGHPTFFVIIVFFQIVVNLFFNFSIIGSNLFPDSLPDELCCRFNDHKILKPIKEI